jgi:hypothetical protein
VDQGKVADDQGNEDYDEDYGRGRAVNGSVARDFAGVVRKVAGLGSRGDRVADQAHDYQDNSGDDQRPSGDVDEVVDRSGQSLRVRVNAYGVTERFDARAAAMAGVYDERRNPREE